MKIVIKVGTSTIAHQTGRMNIMRMEKLCKVISDIKNFGHDIVLVSSGAIGMGMGKLGMKERPKDIPSKQAAAAVGQCELMYTYDRLFGLYNHTVAQVLLTGFDVKNEHSHTNFQNTMARLIDLGVLPIINENDTVSTEEIVIGDNDTLGAIVATSIKADLLIILSDIDGLYDANPKENPDAKLIPIVEKTDDKILALGGDTSGNLGTGGMKTKLFAAQICTEKGCDMVIANGINPDILYDIVKGEKVGTRFLSDSSKKENIKL